ncbi:serine/threonine-protein kinase DDB_G0283821 [Amyelois transitella]|uniref:serine/threonine-protein kinase DDB_G0283821 n=1 Tax=Amyelois transitella TaxID=680683 RepID=UPI00298F8E6E|nr:serine/threonine-protein kinase DDB_G0283821 [Amyelois transitella]XP_060801150.1 serine/threonine-protein kinase DDB_G0283821 [Amyelois transitella]
MSGRGAGGQRCQLILQRCLAIHLTKPGNAPDDFWMYDSGYLLFQSFLAANAKCWWAGALAAATTELRYAGYVAPGVLLVAGAPRALETVRGAYARSVLKPPPTYLICGLGDIEDCIVTPAYQGQFTPLPEALCDCIMDLTTQGQSATLESIRTSLSSKFPSMQTPSQEMVYDTLAQLMQERKIYQTSRGFFIVTPERRRSRSRSSSRRHGNSVDEECPSPRTILMSDQEALHQLYGEITTVRDGAVTHQCVQTNLADVICGGNPNDKIIYGRPNKRRSASFPAPRSLDRRHSLRIFGSSSKYLQRCASTRSLHHKHANTTDSSSSTDYPPSVESASPKKVSLLSRLFRRSGRSKQTRAMSTFSAQFPPTEWFNSKAVHLHCVATQTNSKESLQSQASFVSSYYDGSEISNRSSTLPRRHKRHLSTESGLAGSVHYDHSPIRQSSPSSGSLPRSTLSRSSTNKTILDHFGSPQRGSDPKLRDSPSSSLRRGDYHSDHIMSTSGPSSLESTSTHRTPRKDSNKNGHLDSPMKRSYHNTSGSSGHSSLESHISDRTLKPSPSHSNTQGAPGLSRAQSLVKVQSLQSSPKSLHKYRNKPPIVGGETVKNGKSTSPRSTPKNCPATPKKTVTPLHKALGSKPDNPSTTMLASSNSNNSITLKVTTNTMSQNGGGTNTKVYVQNSPVRSVITFENGKVTETSNGSNIYIINDDRQVVSVSQNGTVGNQATKNPTETSFDVCVEKNKQVNQEQEPIKVQENKFNKNSINDTGMNNNRKLSLQIGGATNNNSFIYKNQLNNTNEVVSNPASPAIHNNIHNIESTTNSNPSTPTKSYDNIIGSLGSLRYQKNSLSSANSGIQSNINSNSELKSVDLLKKAAALQMLNGLPNVNNRMSSDSIANLLTKAIDQKPTVLGSEPNLALKNQEPIKDINTSTEKINSLENKQKRYSLSQESKKENQDFYNFPSLSDLSFNFTSLAAQKILKGVSINSVDTLVELNMAANNSEKQNNREVAAVCTDFGLV